MVDKSSSTDTFCSFSKSQTGSECILDDYIKCLKIFGRKSIQFLFRVNGCESKIEQKCEDWIINFFLTFEIPGMSSGAGNELDMNAGNIPNELISAK